MATALFVCLHNAGRSQMSQALFERAAAGRHTALSAGTTPGKHVHPEVIAVMSEIGIDLSGRKPQLLTRELAEQADVVVTMGCGDACPYIPGKRRIDWNLPDPSGRPLDEVRAIRRDIACRIDALLADLIHNGGDALTAIPLGIAFVLRSQRAERLAGLAVVAAIFFSACVAAYESILRLVHPSAPGHLLVLALAGAIGFAGNWLAAQVRTSAGHRLNSPALIADGEHARVDAYVSLAVIASAAAIAVGVPILDPLIGLGMTAVILRITRESWRTVRGHPHHVR
jgi:arsenate reductase